MAPSNSLPTFCLASAGAIQLLVGPASSLFARADEREVLGARHVARVAPVQVAIRIGFFIQPPGVAIGKHRLRQALTFGLRPVAPNDAGRPRHACGFFHPLFKGCGHFASRVICRGAPPSRENSGPPALASVATAGQSRRTAIVRGHVRKKSRIRGQGKARKGGSALAKRQSSANPLEIEPRTYPASRRKP